MNLPSWSIHDETQDEPAEDRVRLVKLGFLFIDALVSQVSKELSQSMRFVFLPTDAVVSQRAASKELSQSTKLNGTS